NQRKIAKGQRGSHAKASDVGSERISGGIWSKENQTSRFSQRKNNSTLGSGLTQRTQSGGRVYSSKGHLLSGGIAGFFNNKIFKIVGIVLVALILVGGVDALVNGNKIYPGVKVGTVEVGGLTVEEAESSIQAVYGTRFANNNAVFYKNEDAKNNPQSSDTGGISEEDISYDEAVSSRVQWTVTPSTVGATFDVSGYARQAFEVGRSDGGIIARLGSLILGNTIEPKITVNEQSLDTLHTMFTKSVGTLHVDYGIKMVDAVAQVTPGNDGDEVTSEWILNCLNETFMNSDQSNGYVLQTEHIPIQVDEAAATECAEKINCSIAQGALFTYGEHSYQASRQELADWITTEVVKNAFGTTLEPRFDEQLAKSTLLSNLSSSIDKSTLEVHFSIDENKEVTVTSNAQGQVPAVSAAVDEMNKSFFKTTEARSTPEIKVESIEMPESMTYQDAMDLGLISNFSSFTTTYAAGAQARNHNIHTAADLLSYSVAPANGGIWSFNEIAGEATVEKGYQEAHAIVSGELTDSIGGGICQVATTVYNAVYDAGYPIVERRNHTLYIASYPAGRDAAIAYPTYDLRWKNDTTSDVLVIMSYTDTSVTCSLYGVDPEYQVSTETGEFEEGKKYVTEYKVDKELATGTEYVQTSGADGCSITVVRTVKDKDGNVLHEDTFESIYQPQNEIIVRGGA
ncbi:MAG: VanW family protein, partial [Anaerotardibacter sp.]